MFNIKNTIIMAKETYRSSIDELREEEIENGIFIGNGNSVEFMDMLSDEERERFQQMAKLAEQKRKWLRRYEKMQEAISCRDFDEAYSAFEVLSNDLFE